MIRYTLAALALLASHGVSQAASFSLSNAGASTAGSDIFVDGAFGALGIIFEFDPASDPMTTVELLSNELDVDGNLVAQSTFGFASGDASTLSVIDGVLSALLEVTSDPLDQLADFVTVTVFFQSNEQSVQEVIDNLLIFSLSDVTITVADADAPVAAIPLPATLGMLVAAFATFGALRRRA